jgi:hypothetical protein
VHARELPGDLPQGYSSVVLGHARRREQVLRPAYGPRSGVLITARR